MTGITVRPASTPSRNGPRRCVTNVSAIARHDDAMFQPRGKWCIYDPRLPGFIAEYHTLLEARSWLEMTQGPDSELTVVFVPEGCG